MNKEKDHEICKQKKIDAILNKIWFKSKIAQIEAKLESILTLKLPDDFWSPPGPVIGITWFEPVRMPWPKCDLFVVRPWKKYIFTIEIVRENYIIAKFRCNLIQKRQGKTTMNVYTIMLWRKYREEKKKKVKMRKKYVWCELECLNANWC